MKNKTTSSVKELMKFVVDRHPGQEEFHQAVKDVGQDIIPWLAERQDMRDYRVLERLIEPDRIISFRIAWVDDNNNIEINRGYRVQCSSAIGPYKGGLRFHPSVNESILKFLAFEQTFKNALTDLPMGSGKGGSDFNPKGRSDNEIMRFCEAFMIELHRHIGEDTDVPAGDVGVGAKEIGYLFGQYKRLQNRFVGTMTGKEIAVGGSELRTEATGYGVVYFLSCMLEHHDKSLDGQAVAISGSGNVALHAAEMIIDKGGVVVTLSDSDGSIYDSEGLDAEKLEWVKTLKQDRGGRISEYADKFDARFSEGQSPWAVECDIAIPCATQNEITKEDAKTLIENGCAAVVEGANMPTVSDAVDLFLEAGTMLAPGKAANAGGVAVSGLEMTQNAMKRSWSREELCDCLSEMMKQIHDDCTEHGSTLNNDVCNYRQGANIAGFRKVAKAMMAYGVY
jgi:glutamate dehydrogenase/leucine dehydrogenase